MRQLIVPESRPIKDCSRLKLARLSSTYYYISGLGSMQYMRLSKKRRRAHD
jgi:hypothetical protein